MYHGVPILSISDLFADHQILQTQINLLKEFQMLTLACRQSTVNSISWTKLIRLHHRAHQQAETWRSRRRQLGTLSRLDDRMLADIGLTREQQIAACSKLFWLTQP